MVCEWFIYVLKLEDECWYVGTTTDVERRFNEHKTGLIAGGSKWCKKHKPIEIDKIIYLGWQTDRKAVLRESEVALEYMRQCGKFNVRGGKYNTYNEVQKLKI